MTSDVDSVKKETCEDEDVRDAALDGKSSFGDRE